MVFASCVITLNGYLNAAKSASSPAPP